MAVGSASEAAAQGGSRPSASEPVTLNRPSHATSPPFKVVVLNARGGIQVRELTQLLKRPPLANAAVILLCEADWRTRRAFGAEVAAEIAAALDMSFAYAPAYVARRSGATLGNAILSREPLTDVGTVGLDKASRRVQGSFVGFPVGLFARAKFEGTPIRIGVAHLDRGGDPDFRGLQMAQFLAAFPADGRAIVGGDFNSATTRMRGSGAIVKAALIALTNPRRLRDPVPYEPLFERLREAGFEIDGANLPMAPTFTFTRFVPTFVRPKLDWIALRGMRAVPGSAAVVAPRTSFFARRLSDHDFVTCLVEP
jgi:endonuclease/exonuclease/phosphatase family metal-dependent hydrolase